MVPPVIVHIVICCITYVWLDSAALWLKRSLDKFLCWRNLNTDIKRSSVGEDAPGVPLLWNDYDDGIDNFNIHFKLGTNSISPDFDLVTNVMSPEYGLWVTVMLVTSLCW